MKLESKGLWSRIGTFDNAEVTAIEENTDSLAAERPGCDV